MNRRLTALISGLVFTFTPVFAFAAGTPQQDRIRQLTSIVATLSAQITARTTNRSLACAVVTSAAHVRVGEPFVLAWDSVGASSNGEGLSLSGAETIAFSQSGTYRYLLTFQDANGNATSCSATVMISPAQ